MSGFHYNDIRNLPNPRWCKICCHDLASHFQLFTLSEELHLTCPQAVPQVHPHEQAHPCLK